MNNILHESCDLANLHIIDEINAGYISYQTLLEFIEADESSSVEKLKWLELNLITIERHIKKGGVFDIQSEFDTIIICTKNEFYQWYKLTLNYAYSLFLRDRHY